MPTTGPGSDDPSAVETLVVHADDVVTAYEAQARSNERAVLRVTPPFNARMRARIHVRQAGEYSDQDPPLPVHVPPAQLLASTCPAYPEPDETAADIADEGSVPDPERHRSYHQTAVEEWRTAAGGHVANSVDITDDTGTLSADVTVLGR